jgi:hypothetical protein
MVYDQQIAHREEILQARQVYSNDERPCAQCRECHETAHPIVDTIHVATRSTRIAHPIKRDIRCMHESMLKARDEA